MSNNFKQYRKQKGYSQVYISQLLEITQSAYSKKERGDRAFSPKELLKLEELYQCTLNDFFKE